MWSHKLVSQQGVLLQRGNAPVLLSRRSYFKSDGGNKSNGDWKKKNERLDFNKESTGGTALTRDLQSLENIW